MKLYCGICGKDVTTEPVLFAPFCDTGLVCGYDCLEKAIDKRG